MGVFARQVLNYNVDNDSPLTSQEVIDVLNEMECPQRREVFEYCIELIEGTTMNEQKRDPSKAVKKFKVDSKGKKIVKKLVCDTPGWKKDPKNPKKCVKIKGKEAVAAKKRGKKIAQKSAIIQRKAAKTGLKGIFKKAAAKNVK